MIGFSYTYKTSAEVLQSTPQLTSLGIFDIILVGASILLVLSFIFLLIPSAIIIHEYNKEKYVKKSKKKLLTQILLQKEIEDEVEKEVEIEAESSLT